MLGFGAAFQSIQEPDDECPEAMFFLTARPDSVVQIANDTVLVRWLVAKDGLNLPASAQAPTAGGANGRHAKSGCGARAGAARWAAASKQEDQGHGMPFGFAFRSEWHEAILIGRCRIRRLRTPNRTPEKPQTWRVSTILTDRRRLTDKSVLNDASRLTDAQPR